MHSAILLVRADHSLHHIGFQHEFLEQRPRDMEQNDDQQDRFQNLVNLAGAAGDAEPRDEAGDGNEDHQQVE